MTKRRTAAYPRASQGDFRSPGRAGSAARPVSAADEPAAPLAGTGPRVPFRALRNGLPEFRPYTYRGTGVDIYEHLYKDEPLESREEKVA